MDMQAIHELASKRKLLNVALRNYNDLADVLDLPSLMSTCVKSQMFDEAFALWFHIEHLYRRFSSLVLINKIYNEAETVRASLVSQLLQSLSGPLTLSQALKSIGLLRRMAVFTDDQLATMFLRRRLLYLKSVLDNTSYNNGGRELSTIQSTVMTSSSLPASFNAEGFISTLTEQWRVLMFDIIMHFRATFTSDSSTGTSSVTTVITSNDILHSWVSAVIGLYMDIVGLCLPLMKTMPSLVSLHKQVRYFGSSLSKVGADFSRIVTPLFERQAVVLMGCDSLYNQVINGSEQ